MRKWRTVPVGGITFTVYLASANEMVKFSEVDSCVGYTDSGAGKIYILDSLNPSQFSSCLWHELLHAALDNSAAGTHLSSVAGKKWDDGAEEVLVRCLEHAMVPALVATGWKPRRGPK